MKKRRTRSLADYLRETSQTQTEFAARLGVRVSTVNRLVNGRTLAPSYWLAVRVSSMTGIPVEVLLSARKRAGAA